MNLLILVLFLFSKLAPFLDAIIVNNKMNVNTNPSFSYFLLTIGKTVTIVPFSEFRLLNVCERGLSAYYKREPRVIRIVRS